MRIKKLLLIILLAVSLPARAQWTQTNGPAGGYVTELVNHNSLLFAGTMREVYKSTDNGNAWIKSNNGLPPSTDINCLASSISNIYMSSDNGVFLSTDEGNNWTAINNGLSDMYAYSLGMKGSDIYVSTLDGLYKSTNSGNSWFPSGPPGIFVTDIQVDGINIFVSTSVNGIFLSSDNGNSWVAKNTGLSELTTNKLGINGNNIYVSTGAPFGAGSIYFSADGGNSWQRRSNGLGDRHVNSFSFEGTKVFAGTQGGVFVSTDNGNNWSSSGLISDAVFSLCKTGTILLAGTHTGIYLSTDGAKTWTAKNSGLIITSVSCFSANGPDLFAGTHGLDVCYSSDFGETWQRRSNGLSGRAIYDLVISGSKIFAGTGGGGIYISSNSGNNWIASNNGLTNLYVNTIAVSGTNIFVGTDEGVFLSENNGTTWSPVNNGLNNLNIGDLAVSGKNIFAGTHGNGAYLSVNNGDSWTEVNNGLANYINVLAVKGTDVFASTEEGVFLTTNNGNSWTAANNGLSNVYVSSFAVNETNIFASSYTGIFLSEDNGSSWTAVNEGFTDQLILTIAVSGTYLFAGANENGAWRAALDVVLPVNLQNFVSSTNGNNVMLNWTTSSELNNTGFDIERKNNSSDDWYKIGFVEGRGNSDLPTNYEFTDKNLIPGKYNYRLKQIDFNGNIEFYNLAIEISIGEPSKYELSQNYPNPFNPSTVIRYSLPENDFVSLKVFDAAGKEVSILVSSFQTAGTYAVNFDGSSFPSGSYFYKIEADNFSNTKSMILLK